MLIIALFLTAIFFAYSIPLGFWLFTSLMIAFATGAAWELCSLFQKKNITPWTSLLLIGGAVYLFLHSATYLYALSYSLPLLWLIALLACLGGHVLKSKEEVLPTITSTIFGFVYIYLPTQLLLDLLYSSPAPGVPMTRWWLIWTILIIKGSDIAAYFVGRGFGKIPLTVISPKKTWEGFHAGWIGGALCSLLMGFFPGAPALSWMLLLSLGALIAIVACVGDLIESRFKREIGVKDSNSFLPGLGGFLDMADSLLFATPFAYVCFRYFGA